MMKTNLTRQRILIIYGVLAGWSLLMVWVCLKGGIQHDYKAYITQWQLLLNGDPPWSTNNAYGPLHTILGYLLPLGPLAPKFLIVGFMLISNILLVKELLKTRELDSIHLVYLLCVPANILVIGMGVIYGLNDGLVAALMVFAVLSKRKGFSFFTGLLIALAGLLKFYPILTLPFFGLNKGLLDWKIIFSGAITFLIGFLISIIIWGTGPITPILFNTGRDPTLLSILLALKTTFGDRGLITILINSNSYFVLVGVMITFIFAWKNKFSWLEGVVIAYLVMLTVYKVGNQQFYIPFLFLVACLPLLKTSSADWMAKVLMIVAVFLSIYHFGYQFGSDRYRMELGWVRYYGGFASFTINTAALIAVALRSKFISGTDYEQRYSPAKE